ncbi:MAG: cell division ATP-binding protein FtsE [Firmicutes bacterium]|jgi:cell division transport system ATP-binding protein|nr:cell division ATP-binding protein FtsE [Bacillota bacterium]HPU00387.1 cell division ATP-binding protein FtsE [Bacillota bacterium]
MVEAKGLYYRYSKNGDYVLHDLNFSIERGEFVFVIGASGAGKSTLFKLLIREIVPIKGTLKVFGHDLARMPRYRVPYLRRNIGMVFQDFRLLEDRTAFENIAFAMQVTGASRREIKRRVPYVLEMVGLLDKAHSRVCDLSGGEQQRVGLARAIINRPAMIIADEPTGNLDPDNSYEIMNILRSFNMRGTTVLVATHDQEMVNYLKKRVIRLEKGRVVADEAKGVYAGAL